MEMKRHKVWDQGLVFCETDADLGQIPWPWWNRQVPFTFSLACMANSIPICMIYHWGCYGTGSGAGDLSPVKQTLIWDRDFGPGETDKCLQSPPLHI